MATISEALAIAIQHYQAGRLQAAEQIYRQILAVEPNHADAWHLLGVIAHQAGKHEIAIDYIGNAVRLKGNVAAFHLWMGVPVVSLAARTAVGRGGLSILSNVGLPELVAQDSEQYVRIAVELARDLSRLSELRATLRDRIQASPLMSAARFAQNVEAAYRKMWQRWCVK